MKQTIFKSFVLLFGMLLAGTVFSSFTAPATPEQTQQERGGGPYDYYLHATADAEYVDLQLPFSGDGCSFIMYDAEYTRMEEGVIRIQIGSNPSPYPREIHCTFSSDCMGMDRVLLIGQDGTDMAYDGEK